VTRLVVVVSGRIGSGKSTLALALEERFGIERLRTRELLIQRLAASTAPSRLALQKQGERLDQRTRGRWLADELGRLLVERGPDASVLVDSVRRADQIDAIRAAFGTAVVHVHLVAPRSVLEARFRRRTGVPGEASSYAEAAGDPTEQQVDSLEAIADVVVDTNRSTPEDVVTRAAARLGLYGSRLQPLVDVLVGGEYGSEGKGHIASFLAKEYDLLIRVGGPNAGHKVMLESGSYTHHLLPSGTRVSQAKLLLAPGAVVPVDKLLHEIADCGVDFDRLSIDPQVMIITEADRAEEVRLVSGIGSTGQGVGAATARRIMGRANPPLMAKDIPELRPFIRSAAEVLDRAYAAGHRIFLEGTQGTALSLYHGYYPHVTSRDTTVSGCLAEAGIPASRVRRVVMVVRTYPIRVGNPKGSTSGPMSREISWAEIARRSKLSARALQKAERTSTTNRRRRVSEFDWALLHRAAALNGPTDIALTFSDYIDAANRNARRFEQLSERTLRFIEEIEAVTEAPVSLISTRFHARSIIDRRSW
jgi:adenylosuccinate synthase